MSRPARLTDEALAQLATTLSGWQLDDRRVAIHRRFVLADFAQAFGFMTQLARVSEQLDHHPEWTNVYNRVDITLTTHDAQGLTGLDVQWAQQADALFAQHGKASGRD